METNYSLNKKSKNEEKLMKKLLSISLTVLLTALLIVSCSPEQKAEDGLALISFSASERTTRSLTRTNPQLNADDLYWSYTASKTDSTGLTTGTETTPKAVKADKGLSAVGPFSYGDWSFTLYGYADEARSELAYKGTSEITISKTENTLAVTVESQSSGKNGYLEFPAKGTIALTGTSVAPDYSKYVEKIYIKNLDDNTEATAYDKAADTGKTTRTFTLKAGSYAVTVSYLDKKDVDENNKAVEGVITYATDTIYVTIADYLTTKIAGDISENTGDVEFVVKTGVIKAEKTETIAEGSSSIVIPVAAAPAKEESSTATAAIETKVSVPKELVSGDVSSAKLSVTSYSQKAAATSMPKFTVASSSSGDNSTLAALGGLDIDLYVNNNTEKTTDFAEGQKLTVTTYIAKGLNNNTDYTGATGTTCDIVVKYNGTGKSDGTVTAYNATTGELTFTVDHLSSFFIGSLNAVVYNSTTNTAYNSLSSAIEAAASGDTLTILKNITVDSTIDIRKSINFDLGGNTIKSTERVFLIHNGAVSIDNGTIQRDATDAAGSSVIRISCVDANCATTEPLGLTLKSGAKIVGNGCYGISAFGYKDVTLDIYGELTCDTGCLGGNGSTSFYGKVTMNVYEGAKLTSNGIGIYQPNDGVLNIYGGSVVGKESAVEIRAGKANIYGGSFKSTSTTYTCEANGNGTTTTGAAISVAQHTTKKDIDVVISGGTFEGIKQLVVVDPQNNKLDNVKVEIKNECNFESSKIVGTSDGTGVVGTYTPDTRTHVSNLVDIATAKGITGVSFSYNSSSDSEIVIDGGNEYVVDEWQDLWFTNDVTIKNVEFAKGVSFNAQGDNERTITVENCTIYWCDQKNDLLPKVDADKNFRIDNSGNGLCLAIDYPGNNATTHTKLVNVFVKNCTFIGDNDKTSPRKDSWANTADYLRNSGDIKGRGNGVSLGNGSGVGYFVKSATIEGCSFSGMRNAAVQLYTFTEAITVKDCTFTSWGINKDEPLDNGEYKSYALRGDIVKGGTGTLEVTGCTFDPAKSAYRCEIDNLTVEIKEN